MMQDITNTLICDIIGYSSNKYTEYEISCSYPLTNYKWTVKRRYNEFYALNKELTPFGLELKFPPKKTFGNKKLSFIEERKEGLQAFLDKITVHPLIYCSEPVMTFLKPPELPTAADILPYSLMPLRTSKNLTLAGSVPKASWRFCKLYAHVNADDNRKVYSWMMYGPDHQEYSSIVPEILTFLQKQQCPYICKHSIAFPDQRGIGIVRNQWINGSLRDQMYRKPAFGTFWEKYGMDNEAYVLNNVNIKTIARQILEALVFLNCLTFPFVDIHCGNIIVTEAEAQLSDVEFTLCGQSSFNRPAMIRSEHVKSIEDMMVFNFGQFIYEMAAGTLVFPDHCTHEAIIKLKPQYHEILREIFCPNEKMPSLTELRNHNFFENVAVAMNPKQNIIIPGALKAYLDKLSTAITKRFEKEKSAYFEHQRNEYIEELLHSDGERSRRRDLVLAKLRMRVET
uniref:PX domain-containing protein n=1 Tax=Panagrolaimus sp. PS1159 TaxID=55785 RepID=A0AC35FPT2_9BILA